MLAYVMTVNGRNMKGSRDFEVINPATEEIIATVPECSEEQLDLAVDAATRSWSMWSQDTTKHRPSLHKCAEVLLANTETLANLLAAKQGKPIRDSIGEAPRSAELIKDLAALEFPVEILQDNESLLLPSCQECRPSGAQPPKEIIDVRSYWRRIR